MPIHCVMQAATNSLAEHDLLAGSDAAADIRTREVVPVADVVLSVVVPVKNEAENIAPLLDEINRVLDGRWPFEMIYVDDGSDDATPEVLARVKTQYHRLRCIRHEVSCGQSAAIRTGVKSANGRVIVTLDGDGQNDPADIPLVVGPLLASVAPTELGLVAGQRLWRRDSLVKRLSSRVANGIRRILLDDGTRDSGCGLKAFRREAYLSLPYFDHIHRFLPAIMAREGFSVLLVDVNHRSRLSGSSNYGTLDRLAEGIVDLAGVLWLVARRSRNSAMREL